MVPFGLFENEALFFPLFEQGRPLSVIERARRVAIVGFDDVPVVFDAILGRAEQQLIKGESG